MYVRCLHVLHCQCSGELQRVPAGSRSGLCCLQGLRANLLRLLNTVSDESFNECKKHVEYAKLLFSLTYFHSVLLERRKFRALGLNIPYDFNDTDYKVRAHSSTNCQVLLQLVVRAPWWLSTGTRLASAVPCCMVQAA